MHSPKNDNVFCDTKTLENDNTLTKFKCASPTRQILSVVNIDVLDLHPSDKWPLGTTGFVYFSFYQQGFFGDTFFKSLNQITSGLST